MASTTQKKSTTKKTSTQKPAARKSTSARSTASSRSKQPQKRPVRREVGGVVLLVLALCTVVTYVGVSAIFLDWLAALLKGLLGYGYWVAAPAMLLAALILLFHQGRPVVLRVTCTALLPVTAGTLFHLILCKETYESSLGILMNLWKSGKLLHSGGVISGVLAVGSKAVFSRVVSIVLCVALLVVFIMVALHLTVDELVERHRNRPVYEEQPTLRITEREPAHRIAEHARQQIDFPLDDEEPAPAPPVAEKPKREGRFTSFFRHKSADTRTPDQVIRETPVAIPAIPNGGEPVTVTRVAPTPSVAPAMTEAPVAQPAPVVTRPAAPSAVAAGPEKPVVYTSPVAQAPVPALATMPSVTAASGSAGTPAQPAAEESLPFGRKEKAKTAQEVAAQTAAVTAEIAEKMAEDETTYRFPPVELLHQNQTDNHMEAGAELRNNSRRLADTLTSFGVDATPGDVVHGPSVTRYEFVLDQGVKLSKITNLADDIALALGATGVRIAPIPDKISVVGIEVPNKQVTPVLIRDVIESRDFAQHPSNVAFALGRDIGGRNVIGNIEKLPHVLIAGTTGSGKSVCTNSLIVSLLYKSTPDQVRFIMVDPKMVELAPYNGIPHLLIPVVTDPKKAAGALQWAVFEMMKRYKTFSECGVKKLEEYNKLARTSEDKETLPAVVVVIDELADLMLVAAKEVEESICRVAQMGRAAGVHLVIATQRPSSDVITGLMKANIPSRIAFAVASSLESRIILDTTGAEKLVGKGDMLYAPLGAGKPIRVQGCFISPEEIDQVVQFVKQTGEAQYSEEVIAKIEESVQEKEKGPKGGGSASQADSSDDGDELLPAAVEVVLETGQASVSMLQRRLKLGYSRAARLVDQMEERGIVGPFEGSKPRQLLITRAQWQELQMGGPGVAEADEQPAETESADNGV